MSFCVCIIKRKMTCTCETNTIYGPLMINVYICMSIYIEWVSMINFSRSHFSSFFLWVKLSQFMPLYQNKIVKEMKKKYWMVEKNKGRKWDGKRGIHIHGKYLDILHSFYFSNKKSFFYAKWKFFIQLHENVFQNIYFVAKVIELIN